HRILVFPGDVLEDFRALHEGRRLPGCQRLGELRRRPGALPPLARAMELLFGRLAREGVHRVDEPLELLPSALGELDLAVQRWLSHCGYAELVGKRAVARAFESPHESRARLATLGRKAAEERLQRGSVGRFESIGL